jgi:hypothetical protein
MDIRKVSARKSDDWVYQCWITNSLLYFLIGEEMKYACINPIIARLH